MLPVLLRRQRRVAPLATARKTRRHRCGCTSSGPDIVGGSSLRPERVRFAPSPTGDLHLGGLRTALYNFLVARRSGGSFILRIEDTDRARLVPGAAEQLEQMLHWAGLQPDESPITGGPHAPYIQSERLHSYRDAADTLLERGAAYRCFCDAKQLTDARLGSHRRSEHMYDGACRTVPPEVSKARAITEPHTIRLAVPREQVTNADSSNGIDYYNSWWKSSGCTSCDHNNLATESTLVSTSCAVQDVIRGHVQFDYKEVDDAVLIKTDGFPSYHLASVVDDHAM